MNCDHKHRCLNSSKCFVCNDQRLLKLPEDKKRKSLQAKARIISNKKDNLDDSSESWKDLESTVAAKLSAMLTTKQYAEAREARRQARSGAIWFMPGDVADTILLSECKERSKVTASGEKSITINKSWLTKVKEEAQLAGKYPALPFRYKNDDTVYIINEFDVVCDIVLEIKFLRIENENLKMERDTMKKLLEEQEREIMELKKALEKVQ